MNINATIFGQFITFAILIWVTMRYIWPPISHAMHTREKKIADGLEAAIRGKEELAIAEKKAYELVHEAKQQASHIIEQATLHSAQLVEVAKEHAHHESERIVAMAQGEIDQEITAAKEALKTQLATLAITAAEKIIERQLDPTLHQAINHDLLKELAAEI